MGKPRNNEPNNVQVPPRSKWSTHAASLLRTLATDSRRKRTRKILRSIDGLERSEKAHSIKVKDAIRFYNFLLKFFDEHKDEMDKQSMEKEKDNAVNSQNVTRSVTTRTSKRKRASQLHTIKYARIKSPLLASSKNSKATKVSIQFSENSDFDESQDTLNSKCDDNDTHSESSITSNSVSSSSIQDNEDFFNQHNELCEVCGTGGELLCCCTCTLVFHIDCIRPSLRVIPRRSWSCAYCISSGLKGHKKDTKVRRRAVQAIRQMAKITMQKRNAMSLQLAEKDKDSVDHERATAHSSTPSTPDNSQHSQGSDDVSSNKSKRSSNLLSADKKVISGSASTPSSFKRKTYLLYDSLTPEDIISHNKRSTRRVRRQPTLFDPQSCPASEWKSDGVNEWGPTTKSTKQSQKSNKIKAQSSLSEKKHEKAIRQSSLIKVTDINAKMNNIGSLTKDNDDKKRTELWCEFCMDEKLTSVCCFCGCRVCFSKNDEKNLLICDMCDGEYHIYCLDPPLSSIPKAKTWFCSSCESSTLSNINDDTMKNKSSKCETKGTSKSIRNSKSVASEISSHIMKSENVKKDESPIESSTEYKKEKIIKSSSPENITSGESKRAKQKSREVVQTSSTMNIRSEENKEETEMNKESSFQQMIVGTAPRASKPKKKTKSHLSPKTTNKVSKRMKQKFSTDMKITDKSTENAKETHCMETPVNSKVNTCKTFVQSKNNSTDKKAKITLIDSEKPKNSIQTNLLTTTNLQSSSKVLVGNAIEDKELCTVNEHEPQIVHENINISKKVDAEVEEKVKESSRKSNTVSDESKIIESRVVDEEKKEVAILAPSSQQLKKQEIKVPTNNEMKKESLFQKAKKTVNDTSNEPVPKKIAQCKKSIPKVSISSPMEDYEQTLQTVSSFCATDDINSNIAAITGKKSRSGRSIKRNSFHDEVEEGEQHLRSQRYIIEQQKKALSIIEQKNKKIKEEKKNNPSSPKINDQNTKISSSAISLSQGKSSSQLLEQQCEQISPKQEETVEYSLSSKKLEQTDKLCPQKNNLPTSLTPKLSSTEEVSALPEEAAKASTTMVNEVANVPSVPLNVSAPDLTTSNTEVVATPKVPRRKPGARECMQISRRFGVQVIQQKYMDTLLDYCLRGKVEHLIRMRERLDEHSNMLEEQLAGLETLVLERGELDIVVPPPKLPTILNLPQSGDHNLN